MATRPSALIVHADGMWWVGSEGADGERLPAGVTLTAWMVEAFEEKVQRGEKPKPQKRK